MQEHYAPIWQGIPSHDSLTPPGQNLTMLQPIAHDTAIPFSCQAKA
jgi:hypothetical protein